MTPTVTADRVSRPLILAHRGASAEAPENTLAAFDLALRQGADGIELDVRLSADRVPVVIHDARLERTTNGAGRVDRHSVRELRRLDAGTWFNERYPTRAQAKYRGLKIPLLSEALNWVRERGSTAYVELKREREASEGIEEMIVDAIHAAGLSRQVVVISFQADMLQRVRELDECIPLGLDCTRPLLAMRRARMAGAGLLLPLGALVTTPFVRRAHQRGFRIVPWGADTPRSCRRMLASGVDGLITNRPAMLQHLAVSTPEPAVAQRLARDVKSR